VSSEEYTESSPLLVAPAGKKLSASEQWTSIRYDLMHAFFDPTSLLDDEPQSLAVSLSGRRRKSSKKSVLLKHLRGLEKYFSKKEIKVFMIDRVDYKTGYYVFLLLLDQIHTKNAAETKYIYPKILTALREVAFERLNKNPQFEKDIPDKLLSSFIDDSLEKSKTFWRFRKWLWKRDFCSSKNRPVRLAADRLYNVILDSKKVGNLNAVALAKFEGFPEALIDVTVVASIRSLDAADVKNFPKIQRAWDEYKITNFLASLNKKNIRGFELQVDQREVDPLLLESVIRQLIHRINISWFTGKYAQMLGICLLRLMKLSSPAEGFKIERELLEKCLAIIDKKCSGKYRTEFYSTHDSQNVSISHRIKIARGEIVLTPYTRVLPEASSSNFDSARAQPKPGRLRRLEFDVPQDLITILDNWHYGVDDIDALVMKSGSVLQTLTPTQVWRLCERKLLPKTVKFLQTKNIPNFDLFLRLVGTKKPAHVCLVDLLEQEKYKDAEALLNAIGQDLLTGVLNKNVAQKLVCEWQTAFQTSLETLDATAQKLLRNKGFGEYLPGVKPAAATDDKGKEEHGAPVVVARPLPAAVPASHASVTFGEFQRAKTNLEILQEALHTGVFAEDVNSLVMNVGAEVKQLTYQEKITLLKFTLTSENYHVRPFLEKNGFDDYLIALALLYLLLDKDAFSSNINERIAALDAAGIQDLCSRPEYLKKLCEHEELTEKSKHLLTQNGFTAEQIAQGLERGNEKRVNYLRGLRKCLAENDPAGFATIGTDLMRLGSAVRELTTAEINTLLSHKLADRGRAYLLKYSFFGRLCKTLEINIDSAKSVDDLLKILAAKQDAVKAFIKTEEGEQLWLLAVEVGDPAVLEFFEQIGVVPPEVAVAAEPVVQPKALSPRVTRADVDGMRVLGLAASAESLVAAVIKPEVAEAEVDLVTLQRSNALGNLSSK